MTEEESDGDRREDPFEDLDSVVGDRRGDPFERLDTGEKSGNPRQPTETAPEMDETGNHTTPRGEPGDPVLGEQARTGRNEVGSEIDPHQEESPGALPNFDDLGHREGDPFDGFRDAFEEVDVDEIDPDSVWQSLTSTDTEAGVTAKRKYVDVSKHSYCESCEYFSDPPDVHCTHEGTEIVEFLDMETVRVVDCPVVTEREELEESGHGKD